MFELFLNNCQSVFDQLQEYFEADLSFRNIKRTTIRTVEIRIVEFKYQEKSV